jgi:hypothetical protein
MAVALFQDEVFRFLCRFTVVENFYKRGLGCHSQIEGIENDKMIGCLIVRNVPGIMRHIRQEIVFSPIKGVDLRKKLNDEAHQDGAYVIEYNRMSNKVFLHNFLNSVLQYKNVKRIEEFQARYLPNDFVTSGKAVAVDNPIIGTRTQVAMAAGLMGGRGYLIKQTTYAGLPVGKVCVFGENGIEIEFFLQPNVDGVGDYFDPRRKIAGVVRVYSHDKRERKEYHVLPAELNIEPTKMLPRQGIIHQMFDRIPLLRAGITTGVFK